MIQVPGEELRITQIMFCGCWTGVVMSAVVTPMEHVKARLQVQYAQAAQSEYRGPIHCAGKLLRDGGIPRLYTGWVATMFHRGSNWSYFGAYEFAKRKLGGKEGKLSPFASIAAGGSLLRCFVASLVRFVGSLVRFVGSLVRFVGFVRAVFIR
jgi:hypothetical protein